MTIEPVFIISTKVFIDNHIVFNKVYGAQLLTNVEKRFRGKMRESMEDVEKKSCPAKCMFRTKIR